MVRTDKEDMMNNIYKLGTEYYVVPPKHNRLLHKFAFGTASFWTFLTSILSIIAFVILAFAASPLFFFGTGGSGLLALAVLGASRRLTRRGKPVDSGIVKMLEVIAAETDPTQTAYLAWDQHAELKTDRYGRSDFQELYDKAKKARNERAELQKTQGINRLAELDSFLEDKLAGMRELGE